MSKGDSRKVEYFEKVKELVKTFPKIFIINVDNVTSDQMHQIRKSVRGEASILMGKNTLIRKAIREILEEVPVIEPILNLIRGNVGLVFTNGDLKTVRDKVVSFKVAAPAKTGVVSPVDVKIPAGPTTIPADKTAFFQGLSIPTKVTKGCVEILNEAHVLKIGHVVNASQVELMNMLSIMPFTYGATVLQVYDNGSVFDSAMLDIADEDIFEHVCKAIKDIASISLATSLPSVAAVPHVLANTYKDLLGVALVSEVSFAAADKLKEAMKNPQPVAAVSTATAATVTAKAPELAKEESEEELGLSLFD